MEHGEGNNENVREPVIVVSDVHLGSTSSNYTDFWEFLGWLGTTLNAEGTAFKCNGKELTMRRPGTLVLLGGILELWDPRKDDRNYVAKDALTPLSILNELDCDIIYVIGNHDEDLLEFKRVWGKKGVEFPYNGKGTFKIVFRSSVKRGTSVEDVVNGCYKPKKGRHIIADTIVFGHTHNAGWYMKEPKEPEEKKRMFINTGCWVSDCEEEGGIPNTFLYIDTKAPYLLQWDKEEIKLVERREGTPPRFLHEWYQNSLLKL